MILLSDMQLSTGQMLQLDNVSVAVSLPDFVRVNPSAKDREEGKKPWRDDHIARIFNHKPHISRHLRLINYPEILRVTKKAIP